MSDYPRLDPNGLLYFGQQFTQEIEDKINDAVPSDMTGATASTNGTHGLVPQPNAGQEGQFLRGDGVWATPSGTENTIESISVNNTPVTPDAQKNVNITVPTTVSALTNDSGFQTASQVASAITDAIGDITSLDYQIVTALPDTGEKGIIYLVPNSGSGQNTYDEYIWIVVDEVGRFEKIGTTQVDLSGYVQASEMTTIPNSTIDSIITQIFGG